MSKKNATYIIYFSRLPKYVRVQYLTSFYIYLSARNRLISIWYYNLGMIRIKKCSLNEPLFAAWMHLSPCIEFSKYYKQLCHAKTFQPCSTMIQTGNEITWSRQNNSGKLRLQNHWMTTIATLQFTGYNACTVFPPCTCCPTYNILTCPKNYCICQCCA